MVVRRARNVRLYSMAIGITSIAAIVGSLMSATLWYGYVILIPVIISSLLCNIFVRRHLGYDRPPYADTLSMTQASLSDEMRYVGLAQRAFRQDPKTAISSLVADASSLPAVMRFLETNNLFEQFCLDLLNDRDQTRALVEKGNQDHVITAAALLMRQPGGSSICAGTDGDCQPLYREVRAEAFPIARAVLGRDLYELYVPCPSAPGPAVSMTMESTSARHT